MKPGLGVRGELKYKVLRRRDKIPGNVGGSFKELV